MGGCAGGRVVLLVSKLGVLVGGWVDGWVHRVILHHVC